MSVDHIRYDLLVRDALRGVVKRVVADAARNGLPGDHHFFIAFYTGAPGVKISPRLRGMYPEEMTIVLQHQFWDLEVTDAGIGVGLSFQGVPEKLFMPFDAMKGFFDPSVQFGLEFDVAAEQDAGDASASEAAPREQPQPPAKQDLSQAEEKSAAAPAPNPAPADEKPRPPSGGGEVVRLDRFRKK